VGLVEPFRSRVEELLRAAGGQVTVVSGFRTYAQQVALRRTNGCPDIYTSPASSCDVPTARPGESQHEKGLAVDFGGNLALAATLAGGLGLKRTVMPKEPWHFEPVDAAGGGNRVVNAVAAVGSAEPDGLVEGIVRGLRNLTVTGLFLAGATALVVMGGYRTVTGRSLAGDTAKVGTQAATAAATGGTGTAAKAAAGGAKRAASRTTTKGA
jgi:hypothetical protein